MTRKRGAAPTLQDVAREAGVSAMMASVVLNGARSSTRVSAATRERILAAAAHLQYRRNAVAHSLARQRVDTIGVTAILDGGDINLYFLEVLNGILEAAGQHGQNTTVFSIGAWGEAENRLLAFCDGRVDGMILIAPHLPASFGQRLPPHTPFVTLHGNIALPPACSLDVDNEGGAYAMTRYLITQGHRRILHFSGSLGLAGAQQRVAGFRRALEEADLPWDDSLVMPGNFSVWSGHHSMIELLDRPHAPLPTAIFCASDAIAFGCMEALTERGLRVPDDLSLAGFDDILTARMTTPPLTTVQQPFRVMGRRAVELLLAQIHEAAPPPPPEEALPVGSAASADAPTEVFTARLVIRRSVGPPPDQPVFPKCAAACHEPSL